MMINQRTQHLVPVAILIIVSQCTAVLQAQDQFSGWKVDARTDGMRLLAVEESSIGTTFLLQNSSDRVITAYSVCFSRGHGFTSCRDADWFDADTKPLAPEDIDRVQIGTVEASEYTNRVIQISAVLFEDGSSDGLADNISVIEMKRLGRALEMRRLVNILSDLNGRTLTDSELQHLADKIGTLPRQADPAFVEEVRMMTQPEIQVPDFRNLSRNSLLSLLAGVKIPREDMTRAMEALRRLPVSSAAPNVVTRASYLFGLQQLLDKRSSRILNSIKRTQGAKSK